MKWNLKYHQAEIHINQYSCSNFLGGRNGIVQKYTNRIIIWKFSCFFYIPFSIILEKKYLKNFNPNIGKTFFVFTPISLLIKRMYKVEKCIKRNVIRTEYIRGTPDTRGDDENNQEVVLYWRL